MKSFYCQFDSPSFVLPMAPALPAPVLRVDAGLIDRLGAHGGADSWAQALVAMAGGFDAAKAAIDALASTAQHEAPESYLSEKDESELFEGSENFEASENLEYQDPLDDCALASAFDSERDCVQTGLSYRELESVILARAAKYGEIHAENLADQVYRAESGHTRDEEARRIANVCEDLGFEADEVANAGYVNRWLVADAAAVIEDRVRVLSDLPKDAPPRWRAKVAAILLARKRASAGMGGRRRAAAYEKRLGSAASQHYGVQHG